MDRRAFLVGSACGIGAAALSGPARGLSADPSARVLRLDAESGLWRPYSEQAQAASGTAPQRLRLLGPRLAEGSPLRSLQLDLLYDTDAAAAARHRAWRFDQSQTAGNSGDCSLSLPAQGLAFEFRLDDGAASSRYLRLDAAGWPEGDYLIRLDAIPSAPLACGPDQRCAPPAGIDGFLLQVRAETESADLCLRADLACLAQDQASI